MKPFLLLLLFLLSGCMSGKSFINPNSPPQPPVFSDVTFQDIDLNEDGKITDIEVKNFSEKAAIESSAPQVTAPIWATIGIVVLTLIMCLLSAIIKCNKSE